ncbi:MAG: response regulator [Eubacteriales bacterium]|nr:response regulator [Eubacteriales bacterium]
MHSDSPIHIFIAEDEPIILNNIAKKAAKAGDWVEIAGMAESGSEALSMLESVSADILITDIEMPGMNGLELIRTVRELYPRMKIVILSGYSNFEYARTALRYGVNDYLLKPVPQETITELLEKLSEQITEEKSIRKREILSMALNGNMTPSEFPASLSEGCFYLVSLTVGNYAGHYGTPEISGKYLSIWNEFVLSDCLHGFPELTHAWLIDETYALCKFAILHCTGGKLSVGRLRLVLEQYCTQQFSGIPFFLLLSPQPVSCHEIWDTAKKLRRIVLEFSRPFIQEACVADEIKDIRSTAAAEITQAAGVIKNLSCPAFIQYAEQSAKNFLNQEYPSHLLLRFVSEVFASAQTVFMADAQLCRTTASSIYGDFYSCSDKETFLKMFTDRLEQLFLENNPALTGDNLCSKITAYIQSHYCTRLSLNDLSEHFGYTSSYINRIFKKELGIPPLQYITNLKMQKAKELLRMEQPMDIQDVAAAIGYEDARYFSRVFKNETGMTPTAFSAGQEE